MARRAELAEVDPDRLVFLDGSGGIDTRLTRTHARAAKGKRAVGKLPRGHWRRLTVMGGRLARDRLCAGMSIAAATSTAAVFQACVEQVLLAPALRDRPDASVVMDNLAAHKAKPVQAALAAAKIAYRYLPAYSPDLDPDRARLGQAEDQTAGQGGTDPGRARGRTQPGPGHHHRPRCPGLVPPLRL